MSELSCQVKAPAEFSDEELKDFTAFVLAGGEVMAQGLQGRVENVYALAFLRSGRGLIGVAGLKRPSNRHRAEVSQGSGVPIPEAEFELEMGWIFVLPSARGGKSLPLCTQLLLAAGVRSVFATTRAGNPAMHRTLAKLGFARVGQSWPSREGDDELLLFVRGIQRATDVP